MDKDKVEKVISEITRVFEENKCNIHEASTALFYAKVAVDQSSLCMQSSFKIPDKSEDELLYKTKFDM